MPSGRLDPAPIRVLPVSSLDSFRRNYEISLEETRASRTLHREALWTKSLAVGSEDYVRRVGALVRHRMKVDIQVDPSDGSTWIARERPPSDAYSSI
jgi:hypothetical protein